MVLSAAIRIAQIAFKSRNQIYKVLTAQDRVVGQAWRKGGYGRQAQYGARSGALAGSVIGSLISNTADDSPGNGISKTVPVGTTSRTPYKARYRPAIRGRSRRYCRPYFDKNSRRSSSR